MTFHCTGKKIYGNKRNLVVFFLKKTKNPVKIGTYNSNFSFCPKVDAGFPFVKIYIPVQKKVKFIVKKLPNGFDFFLIIIFLHMRCIYTKKPMGISYWSSSYRNM